MFDYLKNMFEARSSDKKYISGFRRFEVSHKCIWSSWRQSEWF
jgi:hypothetical protein